MKKLMITLVAGLSMSTLFAANSLHWQVVDAAYKGDQPGTLYFAYAMVAVKGGGYVMNSEGTAEELVYVNNDWAVSMDDAVASSIPTDYTAPDSVFFVELYDGNDALIAFSDALTYAELQAQPYDAIYDNTTIQGEGGGTWTVSTFNVPEPTSGMLMLLGLAGLALRRKRS